MENACCGQPVLYCTFREQMFFKRLIENIVNMKDHCSEGARKLSFLRTASIEAATTWPRNLVTKSSLRSVVTSITLWEAGSRNRQQVIFSGLSLQKDHNSTLPSSQILKIYKLSLSPERLLRLLNAEIVSQRVFPPFLASSLCIILRYCALWSSNNTALK